jgi:CubicO group peptidase (beta-lactamase class C family)
MCRPIFLAALCLLAALPARADKPSSEAAKVIAAVVKAFNATSAEDLHRLLTPQCQKDVTLAKLTLQHRELHDLYGKVLEPIRQKPEAGWQVYRLRAEKGPFLLKFKAEADGRVSGVRFVMVPADKALAEKTVKAVVKAFNAEAAEDLHRLLVPGFQKLLPLAEFKKFLRTQRDKYGKIGHWRATNGEGGWRLYSARGEKKTFLLRLHIQANGRIDGLQVLADWTDDLPPGSISLADLKKRLGAAVERTRKERRLPSISLALVKGDGIVWAKAFGHMNVAKKVAADRHTIYQTASIFKVVVASAVMRLVDEGKLKLDAPVNRYLKHFKIVRNRKLENGLTLRHLLTHRGGLPEVNAVVPLWHRRLPIPLEELLETSATLTDKPGEKTRYSNLGFALAAYIVGEVSGKPFPKAVRDLLLDPLNMARTVFVPPPAFYEDLAIPYRDGLLGKLAPAERIRLDVYPAGDVYSTPSDMARFLIMHLNGGKYRDKQILSAKSVRRMATLQLDKEKGGFGLGWVVDSFKGRDILWHSGGLLGFSSQIRIDPRNRLGVVLFANKFPDDDPLPDLANLAIALLDKVQVPKEELAQ